MFRIRKGITSFDYCKEWNVIGKQKKKVRSTTVYWLSLFLFSYLRGHLSDAGIVPFQSITLIIYSVFIFLCQ